jgi:hypothetical protein
VLECPLDEGRIWGAVLGMEIEVLVILATAHWAIVEWLHEQVRRCWMLA